MRKQRKGREKEIFFLRCWNSRRLTGTPVEKEEGKKERKERVFFKVHLENRSAHPGLILFVREGIGKWSPVIPRRVRATLIIDD